jgi:hypothetical protein
VRFDPMLRLLAPLVLLVACESAPTRETTPRAKLDTHALPVPLPVRGYAVQSSGIGGAFETIVIDSDARTMRVVIHGARGVDRTVALEDAELQRLEPMADAAWHEVPHGNMPDAHDITQDLFIVDHDDAFFLRGYPIQDQGGHAHTGRPRASDLVLAMYKLANPILDPPPAAAPPTTRHAHAIDRRILATPHTDAAVLPQHGVVVHVWGLGGDSLIVIDQDASTMRTVRNLMGKPRTDKKRKLDAKQLAGLMQVSFDAWHEDATGPTPSATDVREDLIVLDGDEVFYLSGYPISTFIDEDTGRPAAAKAMAAIYRASK